MVVAAIKRLPRRTRSFDLVLALTRNDGVRLVGDDVLLLEYRRYAEAFPSPACQALLVALLSRIERVEPTPDDIAACLARIPSHGMADAIHAAACRRAGAVLISNDKDFQARAGRGSSRFGPPMKPWSGWRNPPPEPLIHLGGNAF